MSKVMLVNVTHVEESRVATLEDGILAGYEIETINRTNIKGNIYNAVVESVHPNLEAAFVKLARTSKASFRSTRSTSSCSRRAATAARPAASVNTCTRARN